MRESRSPPSLQGEALADNSGSASLSFEEGERGVTDVPDVINVPFVHNVINVLDVPLVLLFLSFLTFFSTLCIYLIKSETSSIY